MNNDTSAGFREDMFNIVNSPLVPGGGEDSSTSKASERQRLDQSEIRNPRSKIESLRQTSRLDPGVPCGENSKEKGIAHVEAARKKKKKDDDEGDGEPPTP